MHFQRWHLYQKCFVSWNEFVSKRKTSALFGSKLFPIREDPFSGARCAGKQTQSHKVVFFYKMVENWPSVARSRSLIPVVIANAYIYIHLEFRLYSYRISFVSIPHFVCIHSEFRFYSSVISVVFIGNFVLVGFRCDSATNTS